jgi:hypothetical protein
MRDSPFKTVQYTLATLPLLLVLHGDIHTLQEQQKAMELLVRQVLERVEKEELGNHRCPVVDDEQYIAESEEQ